MITMYWNNSSVKTVRLIQFVCLLSSSFVIHENLNGSIGHLSMLSLFPFPFLYLSRSLLWETVCFQSGWLFAVIRLLAHWTCMELNFSLATPFSWTNIACNHLYPSSSSYFEPDGQFFHSITHISYHIEFIFLFKTVRIASQWIKYTIYTSYINKYTVMLCSFIYNLYTICIAMLDIFFILLHYSITFPIIIRLLERLVVLFLSSGHIQRITTI